MMNQRSKWQSLHLDGPLLAGIAMLTCLGLIILYSAKQDFVVLNKQILRFGLAAAFMVGFAQIPPRVLRSWAIPLYCGTLALLTIVLIVGSIGKGAQRWLDLWIIRFQPAELMKLAVPLMLARYFDDEILPPKFSKLLIPALLILLPALLIAKQPDLGTALLVAASGCAVLFFAGISWRLIFCLISLAAAAAPLLWLVLHDYQKKRLLTLLNPESDPLGSSYQIIQSKIAIGSGGLYGKGWLNGTQSNLEFLPERATDFIFAVFAEEFGFIGIMILLATYLFIITRALYIGIQAQETFSRLLAGSLTLTFFVYVFVNIGMVSGFLPVVGIPLPLVSYGGTSLVTLMASFGILMSIQTHRRLLPS